MNFEEIKKWKIKNDKKWKGDLLSPLKIGDNIVQFKEIEGYVTPQERTINVSEELYEKVVWEKIPIHRLKVNIFTEDAVTHTLTVLPIVANVDAFLLTVVLNTYAGKWKVVGYSDWKSTQESVFLVRDRNYTIQFKDVDGYIKPADQTVFMSTPQTIYGNYSAIQPKYKIRYDLYVEDPDSVQSNGHYEPPTYVYRVEALQSFSTPLGVISPGDIGGYVKSEAHLSQLDNCWIFDDSICHGNAKIFHNAIIYGESFVRYESQVYGNAKVFNGCYINYSRVYDNAIVEGSSILYDSKVYGNSHVSEDSRINDSEVYGNAIVKGGSNIYEKSFIYDDAEISEYTNCNTARIYGNAKVHGGSRVWAARIFDYADINESSSINGYIKIYGHAKIYGGANVYGTAEVYDNAEVFNGSNIYDTSKIYENAKVCNGSNIRGNSRIHGNAEIVTENITDGERT